MAARDDFALLDDQRADGGVWAAERTAPCRILRGGGKPAAVGGLVHARLLRRGGRGGAGGGVKRGGFGSGGFRLGGFVGLGLGLDRVDIHARSAADYLVDMFDLLIALGLLGSLALFLALVDEVAGADFGIAAVGAPAVDINDLRRARLDPGLLKHDQRKHRRAADNRQQSESQAIAASLTENRNEISNR